MIHDFQEFTLQDGNLVDASKSVSECWCVTMIHNRQYQRNSWLIGASAKYSSSPIFGFRPRGRFTDVRLILIDKPISGVEPHCKLLTASQDDVQRSIGARHAGVAFVFNFSRLFSSPKRSEA